MRATKHAPRDPFRVLERRHGLAEIVERLLDGVGPPTSPSTATEEVDVEVDAVDAIPKHLQQLDT